MGWFLDCITYTEGLYEPLCTRRLFRRLLCVSQRERVRLRERKIDEETERCLRRRALLADFT